MDVAELRALLSPGGLQLLDEVGAIDSTGDIVRTVSRLRAAGHSGALVAAVLEQARLRSKARAKFGDFATDALLFTPDGLEQATRLRVAAGHAGRYADAGIDVVADPRLRHRRRRPHAGRTGPRGAGSGARRGDRRLRQL